MQSWDVVLAAAGYSRRLSFKSSSLPRTRSGARSLEPDNPYQSIHELPLICSRLRVLPICRSWPAAPDRPSDELAPIRSHLAFLARFTSNKKGQAIRWVDPIDRPASPSKVSQLAARFRFLFDCECCSYIKKPLGFSVLSKRPRSDCSTTRPEPKPQKTLVTKKATSLDLTFRGGCAILLLTSPPEKLRGHGPGRCETLRGFFFGLCADSRARSPEKQIASLI